MKETTVLRAGRAPTLNDLVLRQRVKLGLTFRQLEARTGLSGTYICQVQNGKHRPSFDTVLRLKKALNLTWDEIEACNWNLRGGPQ